VDRFTSNEYRNDLRSILHIVKYISSAKTHNFFRYFCVFWRSSFANSSKTKLHFSIIFRHIGVFLKVHSTLASNRTLLAFVRLYRRRFNRDTANKVFSSFEQLASKRRHAIAAKVILVSGRSSVALRPSVGPLPKMYLKSECREDLIQYTNNLDSRRFYEWMTIKWKFVKTCWKLVNVNINRANCESILSGRASEATWPCTYSFQMETITYVSVRLSAIITREFGTDRRMDVLTLTMAAQSICLYIVCSKRYSTNLHCDFWVDGCWLGMEKIFWAFTQLWMAGRRIILVL